MEGTGTFSCPICGKDTPHHHSADEIAMHRDNEAWVEESLTLFHAVMDAKIPEDGMAGVRLDEDIDRDGLYGRSTLQNVDITELLARVRQARKERSTAIEWANRSVTMLQDAFFPLADTLRGLEAYLRNTPHHNAPEAAAARKALAKFDEVPA